MGERDKHGRGRVGEDMTTMGEKDVIGVICWDRHGREGDGGGIGLLIG